MEKKRTGFLKPTALLCAVCMVLCALLSGCGGSKDEKLDGSWLGNVSINSILSVAADSADETTKAVINAMEEIGCAAGIDITFTFSEDGKCAFSLDRDNFVDAMQTWVTEFLSSMDGDGFYTFMTAIGYAEADVETLAAQQSMTVEELADYFATSLEAVMGDSFVESSIANSGLAFNDEGVYEVTNIPYSIEDDKIYIDVNASGSFDAETCMVCTMSGDVFSIDTANVSTMTYIEGVTFIKM